MKLLFLNINSFLHFHNFINLYLEDYFFDQLHSLCLFWLMQFVELVRLLNSYYASNYFLGLRLEGWRQVEVHSRHWHFHRCVDALDHRHLYPVRLLLLDSINKNKNKFNKILKGRIKYSDIFCLNMILI